MYYQCCLGLLKNKRIRLPPLDREKRVKGGRAKIDPWVQDGKGRRERDDVALLHVYSCHSINPPLGRPPRQLRQGIQRSIQKETVLITIVNRPHLQISIMSLPLTQAPSMMPQAWQDSLKSQLKEQEAGKAWIREVIANRMFGTGGMQGGLTDVQRRNWQRRQGILNLAIEL